MASQAPYPGKCPGWRLFQHFWIRHGICVDKHWRAYPQRAEAEAARAILLAEGHGLLPIALFGLLNFRAHVHFDRQVDEKFLEDHRAARLLQLLPVAGVVPFCCGNLEPAHLVPLGFDLRKPYHADLRATAGVAPLQRRAPQAVCWPLCGFPVAEAVILPGLEILLLRWLQGEAHAPVSVERYSISSLLRASRDHRRCRCRAKCHVGREA
mmetsp:Transcript_8371/g.15252  ORF Transcript_8371/g.15252 Transcript_8371/m.15252 type:complete len:210 (+) Transcript_8371:222-851(+)